MGSTPQIHQPTSWGRTSTVEITHTHTREKQEQNAKHRSHPCATASFRPRWRIANSYQIQGQEANGHFFPIYSIDFLHSLTSLTWFAKCWEMCRDGLVMAPIHNRSLSKLSASDTTILVNSHQSPPPCVYSILGEEAGKTFQRISRP